MKENIFKNHVKDNELIVKSHDWTKILNKYSQEFIIQEISNAIEQFKIKLPYRKYELDDVKTDFLKLKNLDTSKLIVSKPWYTKFEYEYNFLDKYIDMSKIGGVSSDYFHQTERWKCDATGYPSPQKTWNNEKFRLTLFKALFSLKVKEINPQVLRNIISLRKYIAAQFRPSVAKAIYDMFEAKNVLDFSMGWGDRIAGAYASNSVEKYVGFDPNINLFMGYVEQLKFYSETLKQNKKFKLHPVPAEDDRHFVEGEFDLVFTSPPYYDKEKYDQSDQQSYIKYKKFDDWLEKFLYKTIETRTENLKSGGYLVINISDIYTRKKHYKICDNMNKYIASTNKFDYIGAIGLRMPKRPMSKSAKTEGVFGEPVWIHRKK